MPLPVTRYAKSGDVHVAHQCLAPGQSIAFYRVRSYIENYWEHPISRAGSFAWGASLA